MCEISLRLDVLPWEVKNDAMNQESSLCWAASGRSGRWVLFTSSQLILIVFWRLMNLNISCHKPDDQYSGCKMCLFFSFLILAVKPVFNRWHFIKLFDISWITKALLLLVCCFLWIFTLCIYELFIIWISCDDIHENLLWSFNSHFNCQVLMHYIEQK